MNNIRVEINPVTNYVFHMLSVASVGYDNAYGRKWRHTVPAEDLAVLKQHEKQLTVKGGEHCGEWYHLLVMESARSNISPEEYYARVSTPDTEDVCRVMAAYYRAYMKNVYPYTLQELQPYAAELQRLLEESNFVHQAETLVGETLPLFRVMLVNSVAWGAEAIDISDDQDVFGIDRTPRDEMLFIGHEYMIFLLKKALAGTAAFQTMDTWRLTEGLAEYYLLQMAEDIGYFRKLEPEIAFYRSLPQGLSAREMFLRASAWELLRVIAREYKAILGENLVGVYAHGSLGFGCFTWAKSDIDFLVVTNEEPTEDQKRRMIEILLQLDTFAPEKGFEMSVVLARDCARPVHPIPFSLHYSNAYRETCHRDLHAYIGWMKGTDPDLTAHFTVMRAVGKVIAGKPIEEVFAPVPREMYLASILADVENAPEDVQENPVYVILNLCRVLAAVRCGAVLSKAQGGMWALQNVPGEYHQLIQAALHAYEGDAPAPQGGEQFAVWMLEQIRAAWPKA